MGADLDLHVRLSGNRSFSLGASTRKAVASVSIPSTLCSLINDKSKMQLPCCFGVKR
jgi:hypothetical protein